MYVKSPLHTLETGKASLYILGSNASKKCGSSCSNTVFNIYPTRYANCTSFNCTSRIYKVKYKVPLSLKKVLK